MLASAVPPPVSATSVVAPFCPPVTVTVVEVEVWPAGIVSCAGETEAMEGSVICNVTVVGEVSALARPTVSELVLPVGPSVTTDGERVGAWACGNAVNANDACPMPVSTVTLVAPWRAVADIVKVEVIEVGVVTVLLTVIPGLSVLTFPTKRLLPEIVT